MTGADSPQANPSKLDSDSWVMEGIHRKMCLLQKLELCPHCPRKVKCRSKKSPQQQTLCVLRIAAAHRPMFSTEMKLQQGGSDGAP